MGNKKSNIWFKEKLTDNIDMIYNEEGLKEWYDFVFSKKGIAIQLLTPVIVIFLIYVALHLFHFLGETILGF